MSSTIDQVRIGAATLARQVAGTTAVLVSLTSPLNAQSADAISRLEGYLAPIVGRGDFSGTILVAKRGQILFERSYGEANYALHVPIAATTRFRIASVSKQFVAAGILLLQDRGVLRLTDRLSRFVPELPFSDSVTIRHLLSHTSGLPVDIGERADDQCRPRTPEELVELFRGASLVAPPGSKYRYSNFEYALLALIIERATHQPYADFLHQNFFKPLGLSSTGVDDGQTVIENMASGYELGARGVENAGCWDMSNSFGSGALYSTTHDLLAWAEALRTGHVLSEAARQEMVRPGLRQYGLGVSVDQRAGVTVIEHNGRLPGFISALSTYPDSGLVFVMLGNVGSGASNYILQTFPGLELSQPVDEPPTYVPVAMISPRTDAPGRYELATGFDITISQLSAQLAVKYPGRPFVGLTPLSDKEFFVRSLYARLVFETDERDRITGLRWLQNGSESRARRVATP
jgi:CubicO group peptidase (beta-lactamase class C family)